MNWTFWTGTAVFALTVGAMLWLRDRPPTDVDDDGRRVPTPVRERRVQLVVRWLAAVGNTPLVARTLRQLTGMSKTAFYRVVEHMLARGWLERVSLNGDRYPFLAYRLTEYGARTFDVS